MRKIYIKPNIEVISFTSEDIITASSVGLTNGGNNGTSSKESFSSLFGSK
jgi:hypothetical protein